MDPKRSSKDAEKLQSELVILRRKASNESSESKDFLRDSIGLSALKNQNLSLDKSEDGFSKKSCNNRNSVVKSVSEDVMSGEPIRMMGYLEKKSKVLGWKKFWFVLDGHLLTYFKSKADYENLSPFAGSINLGIVSFVRPLQTKGRKECSLEILTRSNSYHLRCSDKSVLEQWVLALQETISIPPKVSSPLWTDPGVQFYRYSFAAISDWSIASCDNISDSLSNLPKNFYLKPDKSRIRYNSLKNLSQKQKCLSFNCLPQTEALVDEMIKKEQNSHLAPMTQRHSASLFVLESSPQATELKNELAQKLAIGHTVPSSIAKNKPARVSIGKDNFSKLNTIGESHMSKNLENSPENEYAEIEEKGVKVHENVYESIEESRKVVIKSINSSNATLSSIAEGFEPNLHKINESKSSEESSFKIKKVTKFLNKIFKKENESIKKKKLGDSRENMVITGPVDLRAKFRPQETKDSQILGEISTQDKSQKQFSQPQPQNPFLNELRGKLRRVNSTLEETENKLSPKRDLVRRSTIQVSSYEDSSENKCSDIINKYIKNNTFEQNHVDELKSEQPVVETSKDLLNSSNDDNLEKFNRLSAQLLRPLSSSMSRSQSYRGRPSDENSSEFDIFSTPPILPPKKSKQIVEIVNYDVPKNNSPTLANVCNSKLTLIEKYAVNTYPSEFESTSTSTGPTVELKERKISLKELLAKKNSAPEIMEIVQQNNPSVICTTNSLSAVEVNSQINSSYENIKIKSSSSSVEDLVKTAVINSAKVSDEREPSVDIDNIDVLSDISDIGSSISETDNIYENIKYATTGTVLTELETVEELEDEEDELYDEFIEPLETFSKNIESLKIATQKYEIESKTMRHSGILALQTYLNSSGSEAESFNSSNYHDTDSVLTSSGGVISRLGHSSAVNKLQDLLNKQ